MTIGDFQDLMARIYLDRDARRGVHATFSWLVEEVGELSRALRTGHDEALREEMADVLAWLCSLANLTGVDLEEAASKYANGCPKCSRKPCRCP